MSTCGGSAFGAGVVRLQGFADGLAGPLVNREHWIAAGSLPPGFVLQVADGSAASVRAAALVRPTQHRNVGIAVDDRAASVTVFDLREGRVVLVDDQRLCKIDELEMGEACVTPVYNFEVEEFHKYYVDAEATWVHDTNCTETVASREVAIDQTASRQQATGQLDQNDACFAAGTLVQTKNGPKPIEQVEVGDWVLSFPDSQIPGKHTRPESEFIYGRVTKTFLHDDELVSHVTVFDLAAGIKETFRVTANHPFYVEGTGWVPASELQFGTTLTNGVFGNLLVTKVKHAVERQRVYNIEVEDFHSYYVGQIAVWVHNKGSSPITALSLLKSL